MLRVGRCTQTFVRYLGGWDERLEDRPFDVGQVAGVVMGKHWLAWHVEFSLSSTLPKHALTAPPLFEVALLCLKICVATTNILTINVIKHKCARLTISQWKPNSSEEVIAHVWNYVTLIQCI